MNIMIIDDDDAVRIMLQDIIENYNLGEVVDSLSSARNLDNALLEREHIDILIIDMLLPEIDGVQAVARIRKGFAGKIIMLSQVESKDIVGRAYAQGIDYYIMKPLNRNEIVSVLSNVSDHLRLESFAANLKNSLAILSPQPAATAAQEPTVIQRGESMLKELGIANTSGAQDMLDILGCLNQHPGETPSLKTLLMTVAAGHGSEDPSRDAKAMEQRIRRSIYQAHINIATMGTVDYTNPKFEEYAPLFFDYTDIRNTMAALEETGHRPPMSQIHINSKKFIYALLSAVQK